MARPVKLYNHVVAPNPRRVRIFAAERASSFRLKRSIFWPAKAARPNSSHWARTSWLWRRRSHRGPLPPTLARSAARCSVGRRYTSVLRDTPQPEALIEKLMAEINRIANTPCPLAQREQRIAKLEEEIDRLRRTEETIVVATGAPREPGCPPWVVLGVKAVDARGIRGMKKRFLAVTLIHQPVASTTPGLATPVEPPPWKAPGQPPCASMTSSISFISRTGRPSRVARLRSAVSAPSSNQRQIGSSSARACKMPAIPAD
jgi:hypothetical protein